MLAIVQPGFSAELASTQRCQAFDESDYSLMGDQALLTAGAMAVEVVEVACDGTGAESAHCRHWCTLQAC